jgi:hypothetical protein
MLPYTPSVFLPAEMEPSRMLEQAADFCAKRLGKTREEVQQGLQAGAPDVNSSFRYALAKGVWAYLSQLSCGLHRIYLYGSALSGDAGTCSDIDLVILVDRKLDQARTLLQRIDLSLTCSYRGLIGCTEEPSSLLDVHLVDAEEEKQHSSYGAVPSSIEASPVRLWN